MVVSTRFRVWCPQQICGLIIRFLHGCIVCGERGPIAEWPQEGLLCAEHDQPSLGPVSAHGMRFGLGVGSAEAGMAVSCIDGCALCLGGHAHVISKSLVEPACPESSLHQELDIR